MSVEGHSRPMHSVPVPINVRCYSNSDIIVRRSEVTLRANCGSSMPGLPSSASHHEQSLAFQAQWPTCRIVDELLRWGAMKPTFEPALRLPAGQCGLQVCFHVSIGKTCVDGGSSHITHNLVAPPEGGRRQFVLSRKVGS